MMNAKRWLGGCTIAALLLAIVGFIVAICSDRIFEHIIRNYVLLGPNSISKDMWKDTPKMTTSVYIFGVENIKGYSIGEKLKLVEHGPYVYDEYHHKKDVNWNSNGTVTYKTQREYHFNPEESTGKLDDKITIANAISATISYIAKYNITKMDPDLDAGLAWIEEKNYVTKTAREIIFDGYEDPAIDHNPTPAPISPYTNITMDKFAIYYKRNMSEDYDGVFNLKTGEDNPENANQIYAWNYTTRTPYFPGECGKVKGNGELFRPNLPESNILMFSSDLCRPLSLSYDSFSPANGVYGNRYTLDKSFFANSTENEANWCFEAPKNWTNPKDDERLQFPSGIFNLGLCKSNSSTFLSQPHFFGADPFYVNQFAEGSLTPDEAKHQTSLVIDPASGIPMEVIARFQANVLFEPSNDLTLFQDFRKPIFIPAFWFETKMSLPDNMKFQMQILTHMKQIIKIFGFVLGGLGLFVCLVLEICYLRRQNERNNDENLLEATKDSIEEEPKSYEDVIREDLGAAMDDEESDETVPILSN